MYHRLLSASLFAVLLTACGGGGGGGPAPTLEVAFPPRFVATDADSLLVRGRAAGGAGIVAVTVGTVEATTSDGFAHWQARVPLAVGSNPLRVEVTDASGARVHEERGVTRVGPIPARPRAIAVDPGRGLYFVADDGIDGVLSVDPVTGERRVVSAAAVGAGPELIAPAGVVFDATGGRLLVADERRGLVWVDPATGDRTDLRSDVRRAVAVASLDPTHVLVLEDELAVSVAYEPANLVRVDLTDGSRVLVSSAGGGGAPDLGAGPGFGAPVAVVTAATGTVAYVVDQRLPAVLRVDVWTGDRSVVTGSGVGAGPDLVAPTAAALDETGAGLLVTDGAAGRVLSVDLATGDRTALSDDTTGAGAGLLSPAAILFDAVRRTVAVADLERDTVVVVDPGSGDRRALFEVSHGVGPPLRWPGAVTVDPVFGHLLVVDEALRAVVGVQPATGDRQIFYPGVPNLNPYPAAPRGVATDGASVMVVDPDADALFAIDAVARTLRIVSDASTGSGPPLLDPYDVTFDGPGGTVLVTSWRELVRVDAVSGARSIVSSESVGAGPSPFRLLGLAIDPIGQRYLAIDATTYRVGDASYSLLGIDPATGDRTALAGWYRAGVFDGDPRLGGPDRLCVDAPHQRVVVADPREAGLVTVDLGSHVVGALAGAGVRFASPRGVALALSGEVAFVSDADRRAVLVVDLDTGERAILSL